MKIYRGHRETVEPYPSEPKVYVTENGSGPDDFEFLMLKKSLAVRNHSPTGFEWGYGGSGPHQLALALLMHATGDSDTAERFYHDFCVTHVMQWGRGDDDEWVITDADIVAWIESKQLESN